MKRLALIVAILSLPFSAQAANDGMTYEEQVAHTRRCVAIGGHELVCAMTHARTEHIALGYAEIAEQFLPSDRERARVLRHQGLARRVCDAARLHDAALGCQEITTN